MARGMMRSNKLLKINTRLCRVELLHVDFYRRKAQLDCALGPVLHKATNIGSWWTCLSTGCRRERVACGSASPLVFLAPRPWRRGGLLFPDAEFLLSGAAFESLHHGVFRVKAFIPPAPAGGDDVLVERSAPAIRE